MGGMSSAAVRKIDRIDTGPCFTEADAAEEMEAAAAVHTETFATQIGRALQSFPLAEHDEIVAGLKRELQRATDEPNYRPLSAAMVAKAIHTRREGAFKAYNTKPTPTPPRPAPTTPRAPSGGSRPRPASIKEGIRQALEERRIAGDL